MSTPENPQKKIVHSLQKLCQVGVAVDVCNDSEVKEKIFQMPRDFLDCSNGIARMQEIESSINNLLEEVSVLIKHFPTCLLGNIKDFIPLIAVEMLKWAQFHEEKFQLSFNFSRNFMKNSIFTHRGVIDREKAARQLMGELTLKPATRFRIASFYSLHDMIIHSWVQIPNFEILSFSLEEFECTETVEDIVKTWTDHMLGRDIQFVGRKESFSLYAFKSAVESGSEVSCSFFWKQLNEAEKEEAVEFFAQTFLQKVKSFKFFPRYIELFCCCEPYINMVIFLFDELSTEKIKEFLSKHNLAYWVLLCMLRWPYQSYFVNTANALWEILPKAGFYCLLLEILRKIDDPFVKISFNYRLLFREFWYSSPEPFKMYVFQKHSESQEEDQYSNYLKYLSDNILKIGEVFVFPHHTFCLIVLTLFTLDFTDEDEHNARLILGNATKRELRRLLEVYGKTICIYSVKNGNFRCADLFLECCEVEEVTEFKRNLVTHRYFGVSLEQPLQEFRLDIVELIFKWTLGLENLLVFKQRLSEVLLANLNSPRLGENFVTLQSDEFMSEIDIDVKAFVKTLINWFMKDEFKKVDDLLRWVLPNQDEFAKFKKKLTSKSPVMDDRRMYINPGRIRQSSSIGRYLPYEDNLKWKIFSNMWGMNRQNKLSLSIQSWCHGTK